MNVVPVMEEILVVANPVVSESALPNFSLSADDGSEGVRVSAFDDLDCMLERYVRGGS